MHARASSSTTSTSWLAQGSALFDLGLEPGGPEQTLASGDAGRWVGPYRLIEPLGEGGLGVVWRAEQTEPIRREVAVKLIKPGLHRSAQVIARFEIERQALARMSHPHIAAILDAGALADGRPYFVMELVPGLALTSYCQTHALSREERLRLMIAIAQAVHHAHQKGVLHRDLKPSNLLVTQHDGRALPKVIDFGIAKALDASDATLSDPFFQTQIEDTPSATYPYMSPEQAARGSQALDTRSDIYTLGVILYELLTGRLPLPEEILRTGRFDKIASHILDADPLPPSRHQPELRGELDWIILRALEKDPERRYASAAAFAEDLVHYLAHEPVSAGPPTAWYRLSKWSQRHRAAFITSSLIAVSLLLGLIATSFALLRERAALHREAEQRQLADKNLALALRRESEANTARQAEAKARQLAESAQAAAEAAKTQALDSRAQAIQSRQAADTARATAEKLINDILFDLRDSLAPIGRLALLEPLSRSAESYFQAVPPAADNDDQQRNRAVMLQSRGALHLALGQAEQALQYFEQSLSLLRQRAEEQPQNAQRLHDLALGLERVGTAQEALGQREPARASYAAMLPVFSQLKALTKAPAQQAAAWQIDAALPHERLGDLDLQQGKATAAMQSFQAGHALLSALPDQAAPAIRRRLAVLEEKLGAAQQAQGQTSAAIEHFEKARTHHADLRQLDPKDTAAQAAEAILLGRLSTLADPATALRHAQAQADTFQRLTQLDPLHLDWQQQHAIALYQLAVAQEANHHETQSLATLRQAIDHLDQLRVSYQQLPRLLHHRAAAHLRLAALLYKEHQEPEAKAQARVTLQLLGQLTPDQQTAETLAWKKTAEALAAP